VDLRIRRGHQADAAMAADLWIRAREAATATIPAPAHPADEIRSWFAGHVMRELDVWLAHTAGGGLLGLLVLDGDWVDQLYVEPDCTGRGIGSRLLDVAKRERPGGLRLWTFASNLGAQRFYERYGFREVARTDGSQNEEGAPDVLYAFTPEE
jgi:GNAT superfamily N-acetyltransferase